MPESFKRGTGGFIRPEKIAESFRILQGMSIAHFGCGHGYFTIPIARLVGNSGIVYAIDILDTALSAVKSKAQAEGLLNIQYIKANLEKEGGSRLPDNSQDLVLMANLLYQTPGKAEVLREAARVLKKEGILIVIDWLEDSLVGPPKESRISDGTVKRLAEAEGFRLIREFSAGEYHYGITFAKLV